MTVKGRWSKGVSGAQYMTENCCYFSSHSIIHSMADWRGSDAEFWIHMLLKVIQGSTYIIMFIRMGQSRSPWSLLGRLMGLAPGQFEGEAARLPPINEASRPI